MGGEIKGDRISGLTVEDFMAEITELIKNLVVTYEVEKGSGQLFPSKYKKIKIVV